MKILAVSLLRLGDIILHAELLPALKKAYPEAEIHFLINKPFKQAIEILPEISHWHFLDRSFIEQVLVEQHHSPRAAFNSLQALVQEINGEKFDLILNLTHNMLSVRLMDLFQAREKKGAAFRNGKKVPFENAWLNYFNDHYSELKGSRFHYLEILHKAFDLPLVPARRQKPRDRGAIYLQVLTADLKKNWGLAKFASLKKQLEQNIEGAEIFVICSPAERAQVLPYFSEQSVISPSMTEAQEIFRSARLLITGDTSIQHLAIRSSCPVLSLFLGSADAVKTSPWLMNPWILRSLVSCQPCRASQNCSQKTQICAEQIKVSDVLEATLDILNGQNLNRSDTDFEQMVWRHYLDRAPFSEGPWIKANALDQRLNSLSQKIEALSKAIFGNMDKYQTQAMAQEIKNDVQSLQKEYPEMTDSFFKLNQSYQVLDRSFFEFLKMLRAGLKETQSLQQIRKHLISQGQKAKTSSEVPLE